MDQFTTQVRAALAAMPAYRPLVEGSGVELTPPLPTRQGILYQLYWRRTIASGRVQIRHPYLHVRAGFDAQIHEVTRWDAQFPKVNTLVRLDASQERIRCFTAERPVWHCTPTATSTGQTELAALAAQIATLLPCLGWRYGWHWLFPAERAMLTAYWNLWHTQVEFPLQISLAVGPGQEFLRWLVQTLNIQPNGGFYLRWLRQGGV